MSITNHVGTLLYSALAKPQPNKTNPAKIEFFATVAFPPSAGADLAAAMTAVTPNGTLAGQRLTVEANVKKAKPHAGIPDDWLIVRFTSGPDYAPELFTQTGDRILANPVNSTEIASRFYAGQQVRVNGYPFHWKHTGSGSQGVSWNLSGLMEVGGGERRAGGNDSESAFAAYVDPNAAPAPTRTPAPAPTRTPAPARGENTNPFAVAGGFHDDDIPF